MQHTIRAIALGLTGERLVIAALMAIVSVMAFTGLYYNNQIPAGWHPSWELKSPAQYCGSRALIQHNGEMCQ